MQKNKWIFVKETTWKENFSGNRIKTKKHLVNIKKKSTSIFNSLFLSKLTKKLSRGHSYSKLDSIIFKFFYQLKYFNYFRLRNWLSTTIFFHHLLSLSKPLITVKIHLKRPKGKKIRKKVPKTKKDFTIHTYFQKNFKLYLFVIATIKRNLRSNPKSRSSLSSKIFYEFILIYLGRVELSYVLERKKLHENLAIKNEDKSHYRWSDSD